jgi:hypothetical protein
MRKYEAKPVLSIIGVAFEESFVTKLTEELVRGNVWRERERGEMVLAGLEFEVDSISDALCIADSFWNSCEKLSHFFR